VTTVAAVPGVSAAVTESHRATWLVNAANTDLKDLQGEVPATGPSVFLYKGKLTVAFAGLFTSAVAQANTNGYEVTVDVPTGDNYAVTQYHLNQAIKKAINDNAVMNKLLVAEDGPAATLVIKSLIDGKAVVGDLAITVAAPAWPTGAEGTNVLNAYKAYMNDLTATLPGDQTGSVGVINGLSGFGTAQQFATITDSTNTDVDLEGADGTAHSDNVIALGAGDDVAVLGTGASDNDTLVYAGYGQGKDTIVNFSAAAGTGIDTINFAAYLDGKVATTGAKQAVSFTAATVAAATADVNEVVVLTGFTAGTGATAAQTFADLTADKLFAAIKNSNTGAANYGNITAATLDAGAVTGFVGTTGKSVVLIENSANLGEYAAFELTFGTVSGSQEFTAVQMIGVMDFGATQTFAVGNFVI
jgi:hypothetical protein